MNSHSITSEYSFLVLYRQSTEMYFSSEITDCICSYRLAFRVANPYCKNKLMPTQLIPNTNEL